MALGSVLRDKARTISQSGETTRVEGKKVRVPVESDWFRCRLEKVKESEGADQGYRRKVTRPKIVVSRKALLTSEMQVDIISKEVHRSSDPVRYSVDGDPEPYRKRNRVIGWEAFLIRVQ